MISKIVLLLFIFSVSADDFEIIDDEAKVEVNQHQRVSKHVKRAEEFFWNDSELLQKYQVIRMTDEIYDA